MTTVNANITNGEQSTWSYAQRKYYRQAPSALQGLIAQHFNS